MLYFILNCALSDIIVAVVSEVAKRSPAFGALIVSLPLVSLLGMIWLWRDTGDAPRRYRRAPGLDPGADTARKTRQNRKLAPPIRSERTWLSSAPPDGNATTWDRMSPLC
jgi:hypothetical protein